MGSVTCSILMSHKKDETRQLIGSEQKLNEEATEKSSASWHWLLSGRIYLSPIVFYRRVFYRRYFYRGTKYRQFFIAFIFISDTKISTVNFIAVLFIADTKISTVNF